MKFDGVLQFKGTWRKYQARVLSNASKYMADNKIHIVAAPGSGKTTLGIELIKRMGQSALVLAPSITIREQWVARIQEGFLCEGVRAEDYLSQDLKAPKAITVVTYQALHSAVNRYQGIIENGEEDKDCDDVMVLQNNEKEEVDYSAFDLVKTMKAHKIGVLCLDECHHLRSEWWKALEEFKKSMGTNLKVIALTATPPYDSTPALWKRYMNMCGEIDEEITVPELVKEGSLCPHQDFVYFNYPTEEEKAEVLKFNKRSKEAYQFFLGDENFAEKMQHHRYLTGGVSDDEILENPDYLEALLTFLQAKNLPFSSRYQRLLGAKRLPGMTVSKMEVLLQNFLYEDANTDPENEPYRKELISGLKSNGLIEKRKVTLTTTPAVEKMLATSKGKCESIKEITAHEYASMGKELRLLILTDYIRKEYEKALGTEKDVNALGVLPFFEQLRRSVGTSTQLCLGVLCGTIVIIPAEAKEALLNVIGDSGKVSFSAVGNLAETDYVKVNAVGDAHFLTGAVTEIFTQGHIQALIGTKSLLGEGWDSPCINSLILASFVGSFMLSNQMRGRAIRVFKNRPDKTSNIWHLVCLPSEQKEDAGSDYALLERRMEHFLGLHYEEDMIENGMDRLSIIYPPFTQENVDKINSGMLTLSGQRDTLKERWNKALTIHRKIDIVEETQVVTERIPRTVFKENLRGVIVAAVSLVILLVLRLILEKTPFVVFAGAVTVAILADVAYILKKLPRVIALSNHKKRLLAFGKGIRRALLSQGLMEDPDSVVMVEEKGISYQCIYLSGGTGRDKALFTQCVNELFGEIDNQRYILVKKGNYKGEDGFYAVPEVFGKKKEEAEHFYHCIKSYLGNYELIYTRSEAGRPYLLEGRIKAMANKKKAVSKKRLRSY